MFFKRRPRITEDNYGALMTSFGRVVDNDPFVRTPAQALAERVMREHANLVAAVDAALYAGAAEYHLRLLAGSWIMAHEQAVPRATAEVFEEAVAWKFKPLAKGSELLPRRLGQLARGETARDLTPEA